MQECKGCGSWVDDSLTYCLYCGGSFLMMQSGFGYRTRPMTGVSTEPKNYTMKMWRFYK